MNVTPVVKFEDEFFELKEQSHKNNDLIELKYTARSGRTATILLRKDNTYDEYIHDQDEEILSYKAKALKESLD